ncbi:stage II sporulation protein E [Caloramator fervidus]|uniref:Stage II sporulation protein E n=1 Tax=Caloramator fervidus TaxID=29344 RepID=A0A1H5XMX7_9CLOT|nr:stage II sporulation protein E [Caloramator fervidus]SEG12757.1 stage II sporulation protein E [Caloramator fervidus]
MLQREVLTKKEFRALKRDKLKVQHLFLFAFIFFASRVFFLKEIMPFGLALLIAVSQVLEKEWVLVCGIFSILGYLTQGDILVSRSHIFVAAWIMLFNLILKNEKSKFIKMAVTTSLLNVGVSFALHRYILNNLTLYDIISSSFEAFIMISSSYLFTYGVSYYFNKKSVDIVKEEIISLILIILISFAGLWDINYMDISLKSILTVLFILIAAQLRGSQVASTIGLLLGFVLSFSGNTSTYVLGVYGFSGLIAGAFKDMGKIVVSAAYIISSIVVMIYSGKIEFLVPFILNVSLASVIFILVPRSLLEKIEISLDFERKKIIPQKIYMERIKNYINTKLDAVSKSLNSLSSILTERYENNLSRANEIKGVIEKVANKVCANCDAKHFCWTEDTYYTYDIFFEMLRFAEKNGKIDIRQVPDSFNFKCLKLNEIIRHINFEIEILRINNRWAKKLLNSKVILAEQIKGISGVVSDIVKDITKSFEFKNELEEQIAVLLDLNDIKYRDVLVTKNSNNKFEVTIYGNACLGKSLCNNDIVKIVSQALGKRMVRESTMCKLDNENNVCHFKLVEAENFGVASSVARYSKEDVSGDSYYFGNVAPGRYVIAISDGMGSGFEAAMESNTTIALIEKFMEAGFDRNTTIKAINSILLLKNKSDSFATVDLGIIDLYEGIGEFIKVGAVSTFIKSGFDVEVIENKSLPIGIVDEIEIESEIHQFKSGDMIIMVSDGVVDADRDLKEKWIVKLLREYSGGNPKELADYILNKAKEKYGNDIKDDLTVIVSKIWKVQ